MSESTDRIEITEVLNRHQIYIDLADAEGYAGLYASDGSYASPFASATGREKIAEMFRNVRASGFTINKRHFNGPSMIEIKNDRASILSYWWVVDYGNKPSVVFATGTYKDELQKVGGAWKITRRVQTLDAANIGGTK